jgi:hypothetical protein
MLQLAGPKEKRRTAIAILYQIGQNVTNQGSDSMGAHAQKALVPIAEK